jgi:hypothetical protein
MNRRHPVPEYTKQPVVRRSIQWNKSMKWTSSEEGDYQRLRGALGTWTVLKSGGAFLKFSPAGAASGQASDVGTYRSMAEARLAVALYELDQSEPPGVEEQLAEVGLAAVQNDPERKKLIGKEYRKIVGTGGQFTLREHALTVTIQDQIISSRIYAWPGANEGKGMIASTMVIDASAETWGESLGRDPLPTGLRVLLAVYDARLKAHGDLMVALKDDEESPFVAALVESIENTSAPRM